MTTAVLDLKQHREGLRLAASVLLHPQIVEECTEGTDLPTPTIEMVEALFSRGNVVGIFSGELVGVAVSMPMPFSPAVWDYHVYMLPGHRGSPASIEGGKMAARLFLERCEKLMCFIADCYPRCVLHAQRVGFVLVGPICKAFPYHGNLADLIVLSLDRGEV